MGKAFHTPTLIAKKRDGRALSAEEIRTLVEGYTAGEVPDYQMAAWAMAVYWRGMDEAEATALTLAMARSGRTVTFPGVEGVIVDKHSTGGVGDKVSLVLIPLVAAAGLKVAKLSGRGLGHTGGTIDKLESIPGFQADLSLERMVEQVNRVGMAISGSTPDLAPADKKLYALRDVTATVGSLPLIASSIMSKKLAVDSQAIVLDVKVGRGALMPDVEQARRLARLMVRIGHSAGRAVSALLTGMDQPLGRAVGNALEVKEALNALQGRGPADLSEVCLALGAQLLVLSGQGLSLDQATARLRALLEGGQAGERFRRWVEAQGGDPAVVDRPEGLPSAQERFPVPATRSGTVARLDALAIGQAARLLGAGRAVKGEAIDPAAGVVLQAKVGQRVEAGQPLATLHLNRLDRLDEARAKVERAFELSEGPVAPPPLVHERIVP